MNKDFCNKTVESGVALTKTFNYLNTRGLGRLVGADLLFLYQLVRKSGLLLIRNILLFETETNVKILKGQIIDIQYTLT